MKIKLILRGHVPRKVAKKWWPGKYARIVPAIKWYRNQFGIEPALVEVETFDRSAHQLVRMHHPSITFSPNS